MGTNCRQLLKLFPKPDYSIRKFQTGKKIVDRYKGEYFHENVLFKKNFFTQPVITNERLKKKGNP